MKKNTIRNSVAGVAMGVGVVVPAVDADAQFFPIYKYQNNKGNTQTESYQNNNQNNINITNIVNVNNKQTTQTPQVPNTQVRNFRINDFSNEFDNGFSSGFSSNGSNQNNNFRKQQVFEAYKSLEEMVNTRSGINSPAFNFAIEDIEHFLGAENGLYNLSTLSMQTLPKSGNNSIEYINNEAWLRVIQVGSGYGTLNSGEFRAEARVSRDLSTTFAGIANLLELNDAAIYRMIELSNGISPNYQNIIRDNRTGNVIDVLYKGTDSRADVAKSHLTMSGVNMRNHILAVPADDLYIPVDAVMNKLGYEKTLFISPENFPPVPIKEQEILREEEECPTCPREVDRDSVEFRAGVMGTVTDQNVPGIGFFSQLGKCEPGNRWDAEVRLAMRRINENYNFLTSESLKHHTLPYNGVSELAEEGTSNIKVYRVGAGLSRHVGKSQAFFLRGGVSADITNQKVDGKEVRTTWFNGPNHAVLDYDKKVNDMQFKETTATISPTLGVGVELNRVRLTLDYHLFDVPVTKGFNQNYIGGPINMGRLEFGFGLNFGKSKHDHRYSNKAINSQNSYYNKAPTRR